MQYEVTSRSKLLTLTQIVSKQCTKKHTIMTAGSFPDQTGSSGLLRTLPNHN